MKPLRHCSTLFFLLCWIAPFLPAQESRAVAEKFPVAYGPTNAGRDFWLAFPANWDIPTSTWYSVRLYIISDTRTQVKVWAGGGLKKVLYTIPGDIMTVELTPVEAQMLVRDDRPPVPPDRIFRRKAIHIESQAPIVVYGLNSTSFTSDGFLVLPTSALGREYIVASYAAAVGVTQELPSQYMIIAPYNATTVTITHPHRTPNHMAGETFTIELDSGDVFSAMTVGFGGDMSGVVIRSTRPIAVTAGQNCTYVPNTLSGCCCDHLSEMMLPTSSWGKVYHSVPIASRQKGSIYRVFTKEPNTTVYVNGEEVARLSQAGGQDGQGWFEYRALNTNVIEFSASKPIQVAQYNPIQSYDGIPSDPFYMVLTPLEQYQKGVTFCTPATGFPQNFVNMVCDKEGFYEMEITPAGKEEWQPVWTLSGAGVPQEYTSAINGKKYLGATIEVKPGVYRMRGTSPFAAHIYGLGMAHSYGYPAAIAVRNLEKPDTLAPEITKTVSCDGDVEARASDRPDDAEARSNLSTIELDPDPANTGNYELTVTPFEAGVSDATVYKLKVINRNKPARAVVIISDMAGNITLDTIIYNPLNVTMLPSSLDYGKVRVGSSLKKSVMLTNESDESVDIKEIMLKSGAQGFRIVSPAGKVVLGPKGSPSESVEVEIEYIAAIGDQRPLQMYEDFLSVIDDCGAHNIGVVRGQVVRPMIQVSDNDFGRQQVGVPSGIWQMEVKNSSTIEGSTLTVTGSSGPGYPGLFAVQGPAFPFTLEPGQVRTLQIQATPPDLRDYRDTIFFLSDAMDAAEGDGYGWLHIEGALPASAGEPGAGISISSITITPNPVEHDEALLKYTLAQHGTVEVVLVDAAGRELQAVEQEQVRDSGAQSIKLDLKGFPPGKYYVRITTGSAMHLHPLVIVR